MDHPEIDRHQIVDRYLRRELSTEEEARFEEHLLTCGECLDAVEAEERFGMALGQVAERGELPEAAPRSRHVPLAWAASILIALLPAWLLYRQSGELERRLQVERSSVEAAAAAQSAAEAAHGQAQERVRSLEDELARARAAAESPDPGATSRLEQRLRQATRPQAGVPLLHLAPVRSEDERPAHRLTLSDAPEWVILVLEPAGFAERYDLELVAPDGETFWQAQGLSVDGYGALTVSVYSSDLPTGTLAVRLRPEDGRAQTMSVSIERPGTGR